MIANYSYLSSSLVANKRDVEGSLLVASFDLLRYYIKTSFQIIFQN